MKYRYFMLPFIIIFFMILVIDYNSEIVNKVLIDSNRTINYPFFDNDNIDLFIENYLNRTSNNYSDDIFIDYDGYLKENKYYLSFYKYIVGSGKISNDIDSFIIDMDNDKVEKGIASTYMNDYIIYDNDVISNKYIALTFDDGPNYNTNKVLDILEENNVPATFFVLGNRIKENNTTLLGLKTPPFCINIASITKTEKSEALIGIDNLYTEYNSEEAYIPPPKPAIEII